MSTLLRPLILPVLLSLVSQLAPAMTVMAVMTLVWVAIAALAPVASTPMLAGAAPHIPLRRPARPLPSANPSLLGQLPATRSGGHPP